MSADKANPSDLYQHLLGVFEAKRSDLGTLIGPIYTAVIDSPLASSEIIPDPRKNQFMKHFFLDVECFDRFIRENRDAFCKEVQDSLGKSPGTKNIVTSDPEQILAEIKANPGLLTPDEWRGLPVFKEANKGYGEVKHVIGIFRLGSLLASSPRVVSYILSYITRERASREHQASSHQHLAVLLSANVDPVTDFLKNLRFNLVYLRDVFIKKPEIKDQWKNAVFAAMDCANPEKKASDALVPSAVFTWGKDEDIIPIGRKFKSLTKITRSRSKEEAEKNYDDFQRYQKSIVQKWNLPEYQDLNIIRKALQTAQERYIQSLQNLDIKKQAEYEEDIKNLTVILSKQAENIVSYEVGNLNTATEDDKLLYEANKKSAESFRDNVAKIKFYRRNYQAIADQRKKFQKAALQLADCYDKIAGIQQDAKEKAKYRLAAKVARTSLNTGNLQSQKPDTTLSQVLDNRDESRGYACLSDYNVVSEDTFRMQHAFKGSPIYAFRDPEMEMALFTSDAKSICDILTLTAGDSGECEMYCQYLLDRLVNDGDEFSTQFFEVCGKKSAIEIMQPYLDGYVGKVVTVVSRITRSLSIRGVEEQVEELQQRVSKLEKLKELSKKITFSQDSMDLLNSRTQFLNTRLDNLRRQLENQQAAVAGIAAEVKDATAVESTVVAATPEAGPEAKDAAAVESTVVAATPEAGPEAKDAAAEDAKAESGLGAFDVLGTPEAGPEVKDATAEGAKAESGLGASDVLGTPEVGTEAMDAAAEAAEGATLRGAVVEEAADLDEELAQAEENLKNSVKKVYACRIKAWVGKANKQRQRHEIAATKFVDSLKVSKKSSCSGNDNLEQMQANIAKMESAEEILNNMKTGIRTTKQMVNDYVRAELNNLGHKSSK